MAVRDSPGPNPVADRAREAVRAKLFDQPEVPVRVGRFELLDRVGEGGMGVVFAARDGELDREVAIKLLRSDDPTRASRLLREAKAMARLTHPNVVTVYEAGAADGRVYLAMEFVRGQDLRKWLSSEQRSWRSIVALLVDAAQGLAAAHAAGLVHRDFKPENVLVTDAGQGKVADFGLARAAGGTHTTEDGVGATDAAGSIQTLTRTGAIVGTPAYMAPEVLEGAAADARSDQFSFCVSAYEALFGRRPFAGRSIAELTDNIQRAKIQSAGAERGVPRAVRKILVRGLAAAPQDRHPSMTGLTAALERALARRRRVAAVLAIGGGTAAVALTAWPGQRSQCIGAAQAWAQSWTEARRDAIVDAMVSTGHPAAQDIATRVAQRVDAYGDRWMAAHRDACLATHVREEQSVEVLDVQMACLEGHRAHVNALVETLAVTEREGVRRAVNAAQRLPGVDACSNADAQGWLEPVPHDPELRAQVQALRASVSRAGVLDQLGQHDDAAKLYAEALEEADALGYGPLIAQIRATQAAAAPPTEESRDALYEALYQAQASGYLEGQRIAWSTLISTHARLGEYDASDRAARHTRAVVERMGNDPHSLAMMLNLHALAQVEQSKFEPALELIETAVRTLETADNNHPALGRLVSSLGTMYALTERDEDALEAYERSYALLLASVGPNHDSVARAMMNLGNVAAHMDRLDESNEWYKRSLATFDAVGASGSTGAINTLNNLGQNYGDQGQYTEAMAMVERAIDAQVRNVGPEHRYLVRMRRGLSEIYLDAGDIDKAIAECERALAVAEASFGDEHDETASTRRRMGQILLEAGRQLDRSRELLERALAGHSAPGIPPSHKAITQYWLFRALRDDPAHRGRARRLASEAILGLSVGEARQPDRVQELREWLAEHPPP